VEVGGGRGGTNKTKSKIMEIEGGREWKKGKRGVMER
jgi:hypothetical protein